MDCSRENPYDDCIPAYSNSEVNFRQSLPSSQKKSFKKTWRCTVGVLGILNVALLVALIAMTTYFLTSPKERASSSTYDGNQLTGTPKAPGVTVMPSIPAPKYEARSCKDLRQKGIERNGVQRIKVDESDLPVEVYCDMETDGGGWTLVASVHEGDIDAKCFSDDLWSGYVPVGHTSHGKINWESELTFGSISRCNQDDYKSVAYHTFNASDLMVWHVPAGLHVDAMRSKAIFRYRTTNKFLQQYGGNLKTLFNDHFPLTIDSESGVVATVLDAISKKFSEIKKAIPNFYDYAVSTSSTAIYDSNVYRSNGNRIHFYSNRWNVYVQYGRQYRDPNSYTELLSSSAAPFTLINVIRNSDRQTSYFQTQVTDYRLSERSLITEFENTTTLGTFKLVYRAYHMYQPSEELKTICRFYFYISNVQEWRSVEPSRFYKNSEYNYGSSYKYTYHRIDGSPSHIVSGYMLLSRKEGLNITSEHLNRVANLILESVSGLTNLMKAPSVNNTLVVPVTFDKGTSAQVMSRIPPEMRSSVQAGNMQFRAYNLTGYPNAFCPGISVDSISPEYVCVGGISGDITTYGTCGDFAGWRGKSTDSFSPSRPIGYSHSTNDILSTLLFFYR